MLYLWAPAADRDMTAGRPRPSILCYIPQPTIWDGLSGPGHEAMRCKLDLFSIEQCISALLYDSPPRSEPFFLLHGDNGYERLIIFSIFTPCSSRTLTLPCPKAVTSMLSLPRTPILEQVFVLRRLALLYPKYAQHA